MPSHSQLTVGTLKTLQLCKNSSFPWQKNKSVWHLTPSQSKPSFPGCWPSTLPAGNFGSFLNGSVVFPNKCQQKSQIGITPKIWGWKQPDWFETYSASSSLMYFRIGDSRNDSFLQERIGFRRGICVLEVSSRPWIFQTPLGYACSYHQHVAISKVSLKTWKRSLMKEPPSFSMFQKIIFKPFFGSKFVFTRGVFVGPLNEAAISNWVRFIWHLDPIVMADIGKVHHHFVPHRWVTK